MTAQLTTALAAQAMFPPTSPEEMRGDPGTNELADLSGSQVVWAGLMARLVGTADGTVGGVAAYRALFTAAYPAVTRFDDLTFAHAARAIAAFEMATWSFFDAPLDRYLAGDLGALSTDAKRGGLTFTGPARCADCHNGPLLSDDLHHALAVPQLGPGGDDLGRAAETGDNRDDYAFRTPSLRNTTLTGPWMHDGAFADLDAVLAHYRDPSLSLLSYNGSQLPPFFRPFVDTDATRNQARLAAIDPIIGPGIPIDPVQHAELLAFLAALTDPAAAPPTPVPTSVPSGLPVAD
jgi:cytochrome c peroxidase